MSKLEPKLQTRWLINICIRFFLRRVLQYHDYITNDLLIVILLKNSKFLLLMLMNDHNFSFRSFDSDFRFLLDGINHLIFQKGLIYMDEIIDVQEKL